MSDFVLEVSDGAGNVTFSTEAAVGGVLLAVIVGNGVSATAFTYPDYAGRSVFAMPLVDPAAKPATVDYALGYPRVTTPDPATGAPPGCYYAVFAI
jgi:hypothetical protein